MQKQPLKDTKYSDIFPRNLKKLLKKEKVFALRTVNIS